MKLVSLFDLTKIINDCDLSKKYINYLCDFDENHKYRHDEIEGIYYLCRCLNIGCFESSGFIYGYSIPQLSKEFDLLKITDNFCLDIELKSINPGLEKIQKQLLSNKHYLKILKKELFVCTFVKENYEFYFLNEMNEIEVLPPYKLKGILKNIAKKEIFPDLNNEFSPKNILVSPLNSPKEFIDGNYLLTDAQCEIKKKILERFDNKKDALFFGLKGGPGTGKTLLLYDIAKDLSERYKVLILHCGILCDGHVYLDQHFENITIQSVKMLRRKEIQDADIVLIDESHRIYPSHLDKVERWTKKTNTVCLFSFDESQRLNRSEFNANTIERINNLCRENIEELKTKIRTNKEIAYFISRLRNLSKCKEQTYFPNVKIIFEKNKRTANSLAKSMENEGYTYISYTTSIYSLGLEYQETSRNTHVVIGQEFDKVVMTLPDYFYYEGNELKARLHPCKDYLLDQLLYQGLTRARIGLALIVQNEENLKKILSIFEK